MWRAFFLAVGTYMLLLGAQCLGVGKFILKLREPPQQQASQLVETAELAVGREPESGPKRVVVPPDWAPWSLLSTGAVVCLYSFTIPRRVKKS